MQEYNAPDKAKEEIIRLAMSMNEQQRKELIEFIKEIKANREGE